MELSANSRRNPPLCWSTSRPPDSPPARSLLAFKLKARIWPAPNSITSARNLGRSSTSAPKRYARGRVSNGGVRSCNPPAKSVRTRSYAEAVKLKTHLKRRLNRKLSAREPPARSLLAQWLLQKFTCSAKDALRHWAILASPLPPVSEAVAGFATHGNLLVAAGTSLQMPQDAMRGAGSSSSGNVSLSAAWSRSKLADTENRTRDAVRHAAGKQLSALHRKG